MKASWRHNCLFFILFNFFVAYVYNIMYIILNSLLWNEEIKGLTFISDSQSWLKGKKMHSSKNSKGYLTFQSLFAQLVILEPIWQRVRKLFQGLEHWIFEMQLLWKKSLQKWLVPSQFTTLSLSCNNAWIIIIIIIIIVFCQYCLL